MKRLLCIALLCGAAVLAGSAGAAGAADDLADAERLLAAQSYDKALPLYRRLAEAGNPDAQLRLGEIYWFGEGTVPDLEQARRWFGRAATAGNAAAAASLAALQRRAQRPGEILWWTTTYSGDDLRGGALACRPPELPNASTTKREIQRVDRAIKDWRACYNRFVDKLYDALPPGKLIPAEVQDMMTPAEAQQARAHLEAVYTGLIVAARRDAAQFARREDQWYGATERYVQHEDDISRWVIQEMQRAKK